MENGVGGQVVELDPVEIQETLKKGVDRKTQTSDEVGDEYYALACPRFWDLGGGVDRVLDKGGMALNLVRRREVAARLQLGDVSGGDVGAHPLAPLASCLHGGALSLAGHFFGTERKWEKGRKVGVLVSSLGA